MDKNIEQLLKRAIKEIPNYPKEGVSFRDITPLLLDKDLLELSISSWAELLSDIEFDAIAAIEARGFIFGAALALKKNVGFIPIRKKGKLPGATISINYSLEYGTDSLEIHRDAVSPNMKVLLLDDLIATGGTAIAAADLLGKVQADLVGASFLIDLNLGGSDQLKSQGIETRSLLHYNFTMLA